MTPSPRPSLDHPQSPASPFLHNLQQRLRKSSTASRASSQSSETGQTNYEAALNSASEHDTKSTKRYLHSILQDDWTYPSTQVNKSNPALHRDASGYRLRDESVSEYDSPTESKQARRGSNDYKFDSPDDVGVVLDKRRARRRRLLEQEMTWNDGLRIWTLRRDAWTGAIPHKPPSSASHVRKASSPRSKSKSPDTSNRSSSSAPSWPLPTPTGNEPIPTATDANTLSPQVSAELHDGPYLPIYPPLLLASHTLRSRIKPAAYPTLYSKVVIQGLAPNVPIPLDHMINALVEGWKAEGNWPPQGTDSLKTNITKSRSKKGETAFQKWKREQDEKRRLAAQRQQDAKYLDEPEHKGVRKSITGVVKKAFGKKDSEEDGDEHLEKLGLTFESPDNDSEDGITAIENGHV